MQLLAAGAIKLYHWATDELPKVVSTSTGASDLSTNDTPLTPHERIDKIFQNFLKNEEFKKVWDEVNSKLHEPIKLQVSPAQGERGSVKKGRFENLPCPSNCTKKEVHQIYPHSFKIIVNEERDELDIKRTLLFETFNTMFWPKHKDVTKQVINGLLDEKGYAEAREEVEWEARNEAIQTADRIDRKLYAHVSQEERTNFLFYLHIQQNSSHYSDHFLRFKQIRSSPLLTRHIKPITHRRAPSYTPPTSLRDSPTSSDLKKSASSESLSQLSNRGNSDFSDT